MDKASLCRITLFADKSMSSVDLVGKILGAAGVPFMNQAAGRSAMLENRTGIAALLFSEASVTSSPIEIVSFLVSERYEGAVLTVLAGALELHRGGRGTIVSEQVTAYAEQDLAGTLSLPPPASGRMKSDLTGICCIVQRGRGDEMAKIALESGACVPAVRFGTGTGVRDKLGLLRITIPAEKEILSFATISHDAPAVMDMMIDIGKLDQPGRGFIYSFPIRQGLLNTRVSHGRSSHAASIERMIEAIDELKNGTEWRSHGEGVLESSDSRRTFLRDLVDCTLLCNEGAALGLVKAAMGAGAAGATVSNYTHVPLAGTAPFRASPARRLCSMVIAEKQTGTVIDALQKAGVFSDAAQGVIVTRPVPRACTYLGK